MSFDLEKCAEEIQKNNRIDPRYYERYNVKRGLRNEDGSGVLVGLTKIGDVHGYIIDEGEKVPVHGRLRYRGIDIKDLVAGFQAENRFGFEETVYLLLNGKLPVKEELDAFSELMGEKRCLPEGFTKKMILAAPSENIMNKLARSVLAAYSYDRNPEDYSVENILRQSIELIARFPVFVSYGFQAKRHYHGNRSLHIHTPDPADSASESILKLVRDDSSYTAFEAEMLDLMLVLHAEHSGGNNSAFSVHVVSSSCTDTYSAIAAAVGSLKGTMHGGANIKVKHMMEDIQDNVSDWEDEDEIASYLERIINKEAFDRTGLVYGMGHAVYTHSDPRAVLLEGKIREMACHKGCQEEYALYEKVARLAPGIFQKVKGSDKVIAPNVDFYSGFVYKMLEIPEDLYTPLFAVARIAGWSAHRIEEVINGGRITRPAYKHIREGKLSYIPLSERNQKQ